MWRANFLLMRAVFTQKPDRPVCVAEHNATSCHSERSRMVRFREPFGGVEEPAVSRLEFKSTSTAGSSRLKPFGMTAGRGGMPSG